MPSAMEPGDADGATDGVDDTDKTDAGVFETDSVVEGDA